MISLIYEESKEDDLSHYTNARDIPENSFHESSNNGNSSHGGSSNRNFSNGGSSNRNSSLGGSNKKVLFINKPL